ncbi:MAG: Type secretory pathway, ATPase PulE/Tfp pilus assembly pathway, ATPase PilB [Chthonomonadaceae bacterium]|nr:Type secretory pathway, ATPase PulE/Tfp pilus assembly pathway, ATPase PilB [Chthonomonadaceae bacterium]
MTQGRQGSFRLIMREGGQIREMGGDLTEAVSAVDLLFKQALDLGASDIHLQPERNRLLVRYRMDGIMHDVGMYSLEIVPNILARLKLAAGMHIDERREPQDGRLDMEYGPRRLSARMSCLPMLNGEKVVMRLLDPMGAKVELEKLGMAPDVLARWTNAVSSSYGMVLVTGPTGSGKTSTLYASINKLERVKRNIVTVEDPVEYEFADHITQVQVSEKMTFPRVMRSFLRQDPDVMLVGEMRDAETLGIGMQASLTGHLVLSTLHTNNAIETVGRMIDMGGEPFLIASILQAVMAQRLVRTICQRCKTAYTPEPAELLEIGLEPAKMQGVPFYKGRGCDQCRNTGFKGRLGLFEILTSTPELREMIARRATIMDITNYVRTKQGMRTMLEDGYQKIAQGLTTPKEVFTAVYSTMTVG